MGNFNPLLDKKREDTNYNPDKTLTANDVELDASFGVSSPLSPVTGKPMTLCYARDVPVFVCAESRLVLPCRKIED